MENCVVKRPLNQSTSGVENSNSQQVESVSGGDNDIKRNDAEDNNDGKKNKDAKVVRDAGKGSE